MINLAGGKEVDEHIQEELYIAGIEIVRGELSTFEVPYSITGKIGDWQFNRGSYYWMASAEDGKGLPLEVATAMHKREYPIIGKRQPENYGRVIRVAGNCGCPHPREWAFPNNEDLDKWSQEAGKDWKWICYGDLAKLCNDGTIQAPRFVTSYHIDNQLGLNEFARVLREL